MDDQVNASPQNTSDQQEVNSPDAHASLLQLAKQRLRTDEVAPAVDFLKQALALKPDDGETLFLLQDCVKRDHSFHSEIIDFLEAVQPTDEKIQEVIQRLSEIVSEDPSAEFKRMLSEGKSLFFQHRDSEAIEEFHAILARAPESSDVWQEADLFARLSQERIDTVVVPAKELEGVPAPILDLGSKAQRAWRAGQYEEVEHLIREAIKLCDEQQIRYPRAWEHLSDIARRRHESERLIKQGVVALKEQDDLEIANKFWKAAVQANPQHEMLAVWLDNLAKAKDIVGTAERSMGNMALMTEEEQVRKFTDLARELQRLPAQTELLESKRIGNLYANYNNKARELANKLIEQANQLRQQFNQSKTLAGKLAAAESERTALDNAIQLNAGLWDTSVRAIREKTQDNIAIIKTAQDQLKDAIEKANRGEDNSAETLLNNVASVCLDEPALKGAIASVLDLRLNRVEAALETADPYISVVRLLHSATNGIFAPLSETYRVKYLGQQIDKLQKEREDLAEAKRKARIEEIEHNRKPLQQWQSIFATFFLIFVGYLIFAIMQYFQGR